MSEFNTPIKSITITAAKTKDATSADDLHIVVTAKVPVNTFKFADFSEKDLFNLNLQNGDVKEQLGILKLNSHLIFIRGAVVTDKTETLTKKYKIKKKKGADVKVDTTEEEIEAEFEFDNSKNSLLLVEVFSDGIKPVSTKRKVITYEDSDDIDETIIKP